MSTAACIVIGDEILSGRVTDTNSTFLANFMRKRGVSLCRVIVIPDVIEQIATVVAAYAAKYDYVVTSGGVGPTHDDLTVAGIAQAFNSNLVRDATLEKLIREHFKENLPTAALRMADVPQGARILQSKPYPLVAVRNVFILPGVPELFQRDLHLLASEFSGTPVHAHHIYLNVEESQIAAEVETFAKQHPQIKVGSYPKWSNPTYRVLLTLEATDVVALADAAEKLTKQLPSALVVRSEKL